MNRQELYDRINPLDGGLWPEWSEGLMLTYDRATEKPELADLFWIAVAVAT